MLTERFIQDAFSCGMRIERVLNDTKIGLDWTFQDEDVVNQEFSFSSGGSGGRLDVIATFNGRNAAMLCEVKAGSVGESELDQLIWYVKKWRNTESRTVADTSVLDIQSIVGILLAEDFISMTNAKIQEAAQLGIHFVKFCINGSAFPFEIVPIEKLTRSDTVREIEPEVTLKHSSLWTEADWLKKCSDDLGKLYHKWSNCFLNEEQKSWLTKIYKGGHIAIHYKGEYILWLKTVPTKGRLDGRFSYPGVVEDTALIFEDENYVKDAETKLKKIIEAIDQKYHNQLPSRFPLN